MVPVVRETHPKGPPMNTIDIARPVTATPATSATGAKFHIRVELRTPEGLPVGRHIGGGVVVNAFSYDGYSLVDAARYFNGTYRAPGDRHHVIIINGQEAPTEDPAIVGVALTWVGAAA